MQNQRTQEVERASNDFAQPVLIPYRGSPATDPAPWAPRTHQRTLQSLEKPRGTFQTGLVRRQGLAKHGLAP